MGKIREDGLFTQRFSDASICVAGSRSHGVHGRGCAEACCALTQSTASHSERWFGPEVRGGRGAATKGVVTQAPVIWSTHMGVSQNRDKNGWFMAVNG